MIVTTARARTAAGTTPTGSRATPRRQRPHAPAARSAHPQPQAIEQPRKVHLHLHGVTAEDVAELLERRDRPE